MFRVIAFGNAAADGSSPQAERGSGPVAELPVLISRNYEDRDGNRKERPPARLVLQAWTDGYAADRLLSTASGSRVFVIGDADDVNCWVSQDGEARGELRVRWISNFVNLGESSRGGVEPSQDAPPAVESDGGFKAVADAPVSMGDLI